MLSSATLVQGRPLISERATADKAPCFGRELDDLLSRVGRQGAGTHRGPPGNAIRTDVELVGGNGAVGAAILSWQIPKAIHLIQATQIEP